MDLNLKPSRILLGTLLIIDFNVFKVSAATELSVLEGRPLHIPCKSNEKIDSCQFTNPTGHQLRLYPNVKNETLEFCGDYTKGLCCIKIMRAVRAYSGTSTFELSHPDELHLHTCKVVVNVGYLEILPADNSFQFIAHHPMSFECIAHGMALAPVVQLIHDGEVVKEGVAPLNWTKNATSADDDTAIECRLADSDEQLSSKKETIFVKYMTLLQQENYLTQHDGTHYFMNNTFPVGLAISVEVWASPSPKNCKWQTINHLPLDPPSYEQSAELLVSDNRFLMCLADKSIFCIFKLSEQTSAGLKCQLTIQLLSQKDLDEAFELTVEDNNGTISNFKIRQHIIEDDIHSLAATSISYFGLCVFLTPCLLLLFDM